MLADAPGHLVAARSETNKTQGAEYQAPGDVAAIFLPTIARPGPGLAVPAKAKVHGKSGVMR